MPTSGYIEMCAALVICGDVKSLLSLSVTSRIVTWRCIHKGRSITVQNVNSWCLTVQSGDSPVIPLCMGHSRLTWVRDTVHGLTFSYGIARIHANWLYDIADERHLAAVMPITMNSFIILVIELLQSIISVTWHPIYSTLYSMGEFVSFSSSML